MNETQALERLRDLGFDSERRHLRCWLGDAFGVSQPPYKRILAKLPKNSALRGRVLSLLGDTEKAASLLKRFPEDAEARAALGEAELLGGRFLEAAASLDAAIALDSARPWPYVYRSAARFRLGDAAGALRDADEAGRRSGRAALGLSIRAMLHWQSGDAASARRCLDEAIAGGEAPAWALALRASLRARGDDLKGARADADAALSAEELPWARLERALILNRTGDYEGALKDLARVREAVPDGLEPHLCAASIFLDQARYADAVKSLTRALALAPGDVVIRRKRARVYLVESRLDKAQEDLEKSCRMAPGDMFLRQELVQLLILRGKAARAEAILKAEKLTPGAPDFWLGYLRCRQRRYAEAQELFDRSASKQEPGNVLLERAEFYGTCARLMKDFPKPPPPREKELVIVGLGYRHPFQVSVASLKAIHGCEAAYSNLSDPRVSDFLGLFPVPSDVIVFRGTEKQADDSCAKTMAGFKKYKRIAMVTRGLPICYGRLAWKLVEACKARGIKVRCPASVSIFELLPALVGVAPGAADGVQVRDSSRLEGLDVSRPVVIYSPKMVEGDQSQPIPLPQVYPPDHVCWLLPGGGENEYSVPAVRFADLAQALDRANPAAVLYIPAVK